jgi:hypothetical protein
MAWEEFSLSVGASGRGATAGVVATAFRFGRSGVGGAGGLDVRGRLVILLCATALSSAMVRQEREVVWSAGSEDCPHECSHGRGARP